MNRALLICTKFFGYENHIKAELSKHGFSVQLLLDRDWNTAFAKILGRIAPFAFNRFNTLVMLRRNSATLCQQYSLILVVQGVALDGDLLGQFFEKQPKARKVLYLWDSVENRKSSAKVARLFDSVYTFDPLDAQLYKFRHLPLFYIESAAPICSNEYQYEMCFIGTDRMDRYRVIKAITRNELRGRNFCFFYTESKLLLRARLLLRAGYSSAQVMDFNFVPLSYQESLRIMRSSRCIIDVEHPGQRGLTIRSVETHGLRRKLITTNPWVLKSSIFHPANVLLVRRDDPEVTGGFLAEPYVQRDRAIYDEYTITNWCRTVMQGGSL